MCRATIDAGQIEAGYRVYPNQSLNINSYDRLFLRRVAVASVKT